MNAETLYALILCSIAGLSTGIGGVISIFARKTNTRFLTFSLGLSAGVMVYISFAEMMPEAERLLRVHFRQTGTGLNDPGGLIAVFAFFGGMLLIALIDRLIPEGENPHEAENWEIGRENTLKRAGILTALAVAVHNFPEGMATFITGMKDAAMALPIVFAIAVHNIPEGIAVAAPIYFSTGKKGKAVLYSFLSGVAEPVGALLGWLILMPFMSDTLYGVLYAGVSGIMVFISFDELLPSAEKYGHHHLAVLGVVAGMAVMAFSLVLFM